MIPSAWAVLRLMTSPNFMGRFTGRSAALASFEDSVHIGGGALVELAEVRAIAHRGPPASTNSLR